MTPAAASGTAGARRSSPWSSKPWHRGGQSIRGWAPSALPDSADSSLVVVISRRRASWAREALWLGVAPVERGDPAFAKVLAVLPDTFGPTAGYRRTLAAQLAALRTAQRPDGFWEVNLADPGHLPGPETSGTAFFTFAMAAAIRSGFVPRGDYLPVAARAWAAMAATAVHPDGFLGYVQNVGDRPESSQPVTYDSTADFGVGAFLLAGTELAALGG
ncbi:glycoside hydrolase family 88 protein [Streptomyces noursei]|uniref:glycoside hydrolase family 88 protein n=1 Tax=Streptomyces noursei TaxID=1971 RepID=UPI0030F1BDBF